MLHRGFWLRLFTCLLLLCLPVITVSLPAQAAVDPYITRFLKVTDPVPLELDELGNTRLFSAQELSTGKQLFMRNCLNCHVGGNTLPDPTVPLSLQALQGAIPKRNTVNGLVAYMRQPMTYDGSQENFWCRKVPETWLSASEVESIAGFVLRAAQTAPGWGTETFQGE